MKLKTKGSDVRSAISKSGWHFFRNLLLNTSWSTNILNIRLIEYILKINRKDNYYLETV